MILVSLTDRGGSASYVSAAASNRLIRQWRYTCLAAVFALEVRVVLASTSDSPLSWIPVVGALLPWQHIVILHDVFIALSCACGQILPLLRPEAKRTTAGSPADELAPLQPLLDDILAGGRETEARMAMGTRADVQAAFGTGEPHRPGHVEATLHLVRDGALASMVDARVRADEEGAKVWAEAAK